MAGGKVTEDQLAYVFSSCGDVIDCRSCGDPNSTLRFAFVEFAEEAAAKAALNLSGMLLDYSVVKVFPSKTPIIPVNPNFLPTSGTEQEMCERTVYVTHIDKKVRASQPSPCRGAHLKISREACSLSICEPIH
jgi:RNA recognition motif-containing protein